MIDVAIRLLSLCNQIVAMTKRLRLEFAEGAYAIRGYLDRMGFFDHLSREVIVIPTRPIVSGARIHRGGNRGLVEIERFSRSSEPDQNLVPRLAHAVQRSCACRGDVKEIGDSIFNIFGELIGNVFEHSGTALDAYAALQTYPRGNRVTVAVSDSGIGIIDSLRPALVRKDSPFATSSEVDLLVEIFREGISRHDDDKRGLGLMASAHSAIRFKADLDVRLLRQRVLLKPANGHYRPNTAYSQEELPLLWGTHIAFSLDLS
ncbi:hypothetical protein [Pseudorhodoplanes sp.]|uniref:hypothetical protein n=1 Tax=Pseudorhodoplanes sp. TaxID=1934341 RepID=UPI003D0BD899